MAKEKKTVKKARRTRAVQEREFHPTRRRLFRAFYAMLFFAFLGLVSFLITISLGTTSASSLVFSYIGLLLLFVAFGFLITWLVLLILYLTRQK